LLMDMRLTRPARKYGQKIAWTNDSNIGDRRPRLK
jgi:hypothetical protein